MLQHRPHGEAQRIGEDGPSRSANVADLKYRKHRSQALRAQESLGYFGPWTRNPDEAIPALRYSTRPTLIRLAALLMTGDFIRASVLALVAAATSADAAVAGSAFDGTWSVTAVTRQGGCDPTYKFSIQIAAGLITLPGFAGLSGHVADGGGVHASVSSSGTHVTASGNLAGSAGSGQWNSRSKDGTCAGSWSARASTR